MWRQEACLRWLPLTRPAPATATATAVPAHAKGVGQTSSARMRQMSAVAPARRARSAIASRGCALVILPRPQQLVALVELGLAEAERRVVKAVVAAEWTVALETSQISAKRKTRPKRRPRPRLRPPNAAPTGSTTTPLHSATATTRGTAPMRQKAKFATGSIAQGTKTARRSATDRDCAWTGSATASPGSGFLTRAKARIRAQIQFA